MPKKGNRVTVNQHTVVKPEVLVKTAVGALEAELVLPNTFARTGIDQFKGAANDTVNFTVEGVLPHHLYGWRNNRSSPIQFDTYSERKIAVTFGGNAYSAVQMIDEQADMDMARWGKLLGVQAKAVARGLNRSAAATMVGGDYEVVIGDAFASIKGSVIEARRALNALHAPASGRVMVVGTNWESLLLSVPELNLAQNVGDSEAEHQLTEATLGKRYGFRFIVDQTINPDEAYAFADSGFVFANAAPSVPQSVKAGATTSFEGIALRWIQDYSADFLTDRSVINTYFGFRQVKDPLVYWDPTANGGTGTEVVTSAEYNCRSVKLLLDGASKYPTAASELGKATGLTGPGKQQTGAAGTLADD